MSTHGVPVPQRLLAPVDKAMKEGKWQQAKALLLKLEASYPHALPVHVGLCRTLRQLHEMPGSVRHARRAVELAPEQAELTVELAVSMAIAGEPGAEEALVAELQRDPHNQWVRNNLVKWYHDGHRWGDLAACISAGAALGQATPAFYVGWATALSQMGRTEEAAKILGQGQLRFPSERLITEMACFCHNYIYPPDPPRCLSVHRNFGRILAQTFPPPARPALRAAAGRRLRVGFLSPDLRWHAVAHFLLPLLTHLDRTAFEVVGLYNNLRTDDMTARIKGLCDQWMVMHSDTPAALAAKVRALDLDILVELSGVTGGNLLPLLQMRVAPVQMTYIGYPNTTGVEQVDYRIVDGITDPAGDPYDAQAFATERLARMDPCFLCFSPPVGRRSPDLRHAPLAGSDRPVVFGCFNATYKLNHYVMGLWARVLHAVPGSRIIYKALALEDEITRRDLARSFAAAGLPAERVELREPQHDEVDHIAIYNEVDIGLDTYPYHGTTTTCESLHMGVPVVTLRGDTHASRVGASLLAAAGLGELVAGSEEEFIAITRRLSGDRQRLDDLHVNLRARLAASTLCDGPAAAARFGRLLRECWQRFESVQTKS